MDRACREITRDVRKIIEFIQKEKDDAKKDALMALYHDIKYFIDTWDGSDSIARADRRYYQHVVYLWGKLLQQENGRKVIVVCMNGITAPDALYYGMWPTVRGISAAQLSMMESFVDEMRQKATAIESMVVDIVDADVTIEEDTVDNAVGTIDNSDTGPTTSTQAIVPTDPSGPATFQLKDGICTNIVSLEEFNNLTIDDLVEKVVNRTKQILDSQESRDEKTDTTTVIGDTVDADPVAIELTNESSQDTPQEKPVKIGSVVQESRDSGLDSQTLPLPNVHIDMLDGPEDAQNDDFSEDSWFDEHAADLIQSTPTGANAIAPKPDVPTAPVKGNYGKLTIELKESGFQFYCDKWATVAQFNDFRTLQHFLHDVVQGPGMNRWYTNGYRLRRKNYRHSKIGQNFPNFDFSRIYRAKISPEVRIPNYRNTTDIVNYPIDFKNAYYTVNSPQSLAQQAKRVLTRQDAVRARKPPNVRQLRLHNRKGSRGSGDGSMDSPNRSIDEPAKDKAMDDFTVKLSLEILSLRSKLQKLESRFKDE